jgi:maleylpyruvate isomerase
MICRPPQVLHALLYGCGDAPTLADVYLVPQVESARRFKVDMSRCP